MSTWHGTGFNFCRTFRDNHQKSRITQRLWVSRWRPIQNFGFKATRTRTA